HGEQCHQNKHRGSTQCSYVQHEFIETRTPAVAKPGENACVKLTYPPHPRHPTFLEQRPLSRFHRIPRLTGILWIGYIHVSDHDLRAPLQDSVDLERNPRHQLRLARVVESPEERSQSGPHLFLFLGERPTAGNSRMAQD